MMDLHSRLERLGGPIAAPSASDIEADLARVHRTLRRRRIGQAVAGSAFGLAAVLAAFSFAGTPSLDRGTAGPSPVVAEAAGGHVRLVDYRGAQPKYFTVDRVPAGFFVQSADDVGLMMAPVAARNPGPGVNPSASPIYDPRSFDGKIGVFLEHKTYRGTPGGERVTVGDKPGILLKLPPVGTAPGDPTPAPADTDAAWQLFVDESPDVWAIVQFAEGLGLSKDQMIEVGAGLHVHREAIDAVQPPRTTKAPN